MSWRPAATTILANIELRQVLMMRRGPTAKFMPNSFVFPGGLLELNTDSNFPVEKTNFANVSYEPIRMQGYDNDFPFRVAAVRELFEETGILLVENENTRESLLVTHEDDKSLADWRIKVSQNPKLFEELFTGANKLDAKSLLPWSNWLTPASYKKRFDTMFFVVPTKTSTSVTACEREMADSEWIAPSDIIEKCSGEGKYGLPPPQFYELARLRLSQPGYLADMANPYRICPQVVEVIDKPGLRYTILPGDHLFQNDLADDAPLRKLLLSEINPPEQESEKLPVHRISFSMSPVLYTSHELHIKNPSKVHPKFHLFYVDSTNLFNGA
uniref:Nudix hydrolase domain-containing protein n=1 Tax=Acrobeloides nanus TaxID=290746 RepID=A0A914EA86_9BILA